MALLRRRGDDAHTVRFQMREKLLSSGDDYWIEDDSGRKAFKVNGKALRVRTHGSSKTRTVVPSRPFGSGNCRSGTQSRSSSATEQRP